MTPFWITFYSYKGGVGRSLALANTAALLVKRGRRVVLIDFDLEAPGLDSFEEFHCVAGKPGVVEYVTRYKDIKQAPDIQRFVHPCDLPGPLRGKLWIMPAGKKDAAYNASRANLNWADLYENHYGEQFVENWKAAIARQCQPDYVFVDSRTGLTDVAGICTLHLPDLVVMLFSLNDQNVKGVAAVSKTIRESESAKLPQIHYVASPVPNLPREKTGPIVQRLTAATEQFGAKIKSFIGYQHIAALHEHLFVLDSEIESSLLVNDYDELLEKLVEYNRNGLDFLLKQADEAMEKPDTSIIERLLAVLAQEFPDCPEALMARARLKKALLDGSSAKALAAQAIEANPAYSEPFEWLLDTHRREKNLRAAQELCNSLLQQASKLSSERLNALYFDAGDSAMATGDYPDAVQTYALGVKLVDKKKRQDELDPERLLTIMFNATEAKRRVTHEAQIQCWRALISQFEHAGKTTASPLPLQAKRWQAMHIAFAMVGDVDRAREALSKARQAAERLGPAEDIFTVKTYTDVPVKDFLQANDEMLAALDRGQLWDGMPLPPPTEQTADKDPTPPEGSQPPDSAPPPPRRKRGRIINLEED